MTGLTIRAESHIHETILFGFPGRRDDAIVINYCILYAKDYIYLEKPKENNNRNTLNIDFLGYLSKLKYILKIKKNPYVIKVSSLISSILYMTTYGLHKCDFLM